MSFTYSKNKFVVAGLQANAGQLVSEICARQKALAEPSDPAAELRRPKALLDAGVLTPAQYSLLCKQFPERS
jgi:hypothetical protein